MSIQLLTSRAMKSVCVVTILMLFACGSSQPVAGTNPPPPSTAEPSPQAAPISEDETGSEPSGDACAAAGGHCVAVSACAPAAGHLMEVSCNAAHLACCITPADSCGGPEDFACCRDGAEFRPTCRAGKLECASGMTRCPAT